MGDFDLYLGQIKITNDNDFDPVYEGIAENTQDISDINNELNKLEGTETVNGSIRYIINDVTSGLTASDIAVEGEYEGDNIEDVLLELFQLVSGATLINQVTCDVDTESPDSVAKYTFWQNSRTVANLVVPNDIHVTGGEISEHDGVKYLVLHTDEGDISINASSLVDYITGGNTAEINVSIDANTHIISSMVNKISSDKIEYANNTSVSDALDDLYENKVSISELQSDNIGHGSGTVSDKLIEDEEDINDIHDLIGDVSSLDDNTLVEYIQSCGDDAISSLDSSIAAVTGNVLIGFNITSGKISGNTKTELDAENIVYSNDKSVADKLNESKSSIENLDNKIGEIPATSTASNLIEYADKSVQDIDLSARNITVADTHKNFSGLNNVEDILSFLLLKRNFIATQDDIAGVFDENDRLIINWNGLLDLGLDITRDYRSHSLTDETIGAADSVLYRNGLSGKFVVSNTVNYIGNYNFEDGDITSVVIPGSVVTIGAWAFCDCTHLTRATIQEGTRIIKTCCFAGNTGLYDSWTLDLPQTITEIEDFALSNEYLIGINYAGTSSQFRQIVKGVGWRKNIQWRKCPVVCTDGTFTVLDF